MVKRSPAATSTDEAERSRHDVAIGVRRVIALSVLYNDQVSARVGMSMTQIGEFLRSDLRSRMGGASSEGEGFEQGHRAGQRKNSWTIKASQYPNVFAADDAEGQADLRLSDVFGQLFFNQFACLIQRQAPHIEAWEQIIIDFAIQTDRREGAGRGRASDDFDFDYITGTERKGSAGWMKHLGGQWRLDDFAADICDSGSARVAEWGVI